MVEPRGFTLLESLAVVVILGAAMLAALGASGGVAGSRDSGLAELELRSALAHARQVAVRTGGAELVVSHDLAVRTENRDRPLKIRRFGLPPKTVVRLASGHERVAFDAAGRCAPCGFVIESDNAAPVGYRLNGVTGELTKLVRETSS